MPVRAAAIVLGCHENTIRNYIANGTLDAVALPSGVRRPTTESVLKRARVSSSAELVDIASRLRDEAELLEAPSGCPHGSGSPARPGGR
jgi:predicted site-specific integrase-resolvase